jgi:hypothetical protein
MVGAYWRGMPAACKVFVSFLKREDRPPVILAEPRHLRSCGVSWGSTHLQLSQSEATTGAGAAVVLDGGASDNGAELVDGARGDSSGLSLTSVPARDLLAGLYSIVC